MRARTHSLQNGCRVSCGLAVLGGECVLVCPAWSSSPHELSVCMVWEEWGHEDPCWVRGACPAESVPVPPEGYSKEALMTAAVGSLASWSLFQLLRQQVAETPPSSPSPCKDQLFKCIKEPVISSWFTMPSVAHRVQLRRCAWTLPAPSSHILPPDASEKSLTKISGVLHLSCGGDCVQRSPGFCMGCAASSGSTRHSPYDIYFLLC